MENGNARGYCKLNTSRTSLSTSKSKIKQTVLTNFVSSQIRTNSNQSKFDERCNDSGSSWEFPEGDRNVVSSSKTNWQKREVNSQKNTVITSSKCNLIHNGNHVDDDDGDDIIISSSDDEFATIRNSSKTHGISTPINKKNESISSIPETPEKIEEKTVESEFSISLSGETPKSTKKSLFSKARLLKSSSSEFSGSEASQNSEECLELWLENMKTISNDVKLSSNMEINELESALNKLEHLNIDLLNKAFSILTTLPPFLLELIPCFKGNSAVIDKVKDFHGNIRAEINRAKALVKKTCREQRENHKNVNNQHALPVKSDDFDDLIESNMYHDIIFNDEDEMCDQKNYTASLSQPKIEELNNSSEEIRRLPSESIKENFTIRKSVENNSSSIFKSNEVTTLSSPRRNVTELLVSGNAPTPSFESFRIKKPVRNEVTTPQTITPSEDSRNSVESGNSTGETPSFGGFRIKKPQLAKLKLSSTLNVSNDISPPVIVKQQSNIESVAVNKPEVPTNLISNNISKTEPFKVKTKTDLTSVGSIKPSTVSLSQGFSPSNNFSATEQTYKSVMPNYQQTNSLTSTLGANKPQTKDVTLSNNNSAFKSTPVSSNSPPKTKTRTNLLKHLSHSQQIEDSSGEFKSTNYLHSPELFRVFKEKFGLHQFRPNQLEAINAALLNHDCFVLMPTGGGKSLCYQLPALLTTGVTIVISPLRSLIFDQTQKLKLLDIGAACLTSDINATQECEIYRQLYVYTNEPDLKVLFVTPEKISASSRLEDVFQDLYKKGLLSRFVIDECHCVSQWGHDFRPDYKKLKLLRKKYPNVPIMALTATATPRVRNDILVQLDLHSPKWFLSSFDRPNLKYEVHKKSGKAALVEILGLLKTKFAKDSGIIYCLSRNDCDTLAKQLKLNSIRGDSYHAGLSDSKRKEIQTKWITDKIKVVCATIAFGMGIDKPDVRYVIHYSLPKSIEGYYQEAGRAGRDGEKAHCILYYSYHDLHRIMKLIEMDSEGTPETRQIHKDNVQSMLAYADNKTDCRRVIQLNYFGERFPRSNCKSRISTTCDNCLSQDDYKSVDVTPIAKEFVQAVKDLCGDPSRQSYHYNFTVAHLVDIFKGSVSKKIISAGHQNHKLHGKGKTWLKTDVERLVRQLIRDEYLQEISVPSRDGIVHSYTKTGRKIGQLLSCNAKVSLAMKVGGKKVEASVNENVPKDEVDNALKEIHDNCYKELLNKVRDIALELGVNSSSIMNTEALKSMSKQLPQNEEEMLKIVGVTKANFDKYGKQLLGVIEGFAAVRDVMLYEKTGTNSQEVDAEKDDNDSEDDVAKGWLSSRTESPYFANEPSSSSYSFKSYKGKRKRKFRAKGSRAKRPKRATATSTGETSAPPARARIAAAAAKKSAAATKIAAFKAGRSSTHSNGFIPLPKKINL